MDRRDSDPLRGEAVTLWRLERPHDHLRCFLVEPPRGFWLGIERGHDLVFSETYAELDAALRRAEALKSPLLAAGWLEPAGDAPSPAAERSPDKHRR